MLVNQEFLLAGQQTACAPLDFVKAVQEQLPIFRHTTAEEMQDRMRVLFESDHRYEYTVTDDDGQTLAIMVIGADGREAHIGHKVIYPVMACSLKPGLLFGAYRWLIQLAKAEGFEWYGISRTEGHTISMTYKPIK